MENTNVSNSETGKRGLFVWRGHHREVLTHEPYRFRFGSKERGAAWTAIAYQLEDMGMKVNQRSVREKFSRMMTSFKKNEAAEKRARGVEVEFTEKDQALVDILEKMECEEENEQERQKENYEKETAAEMRKQAVERLGETRERTNGNVEEDGETPPEGKRKRSGELVEVLRESVWATRNREETDRDFREREMRLREQQAANQQQFQQSILE